MKIEFTKRVEYDVKFLKVDVGVRYWEDALVNGVEDETGELIPFRKGNRWQIMIDVDLGRIIQWPEVAADTHYKVCDDGIYTLYDKDMNEIYSVESYVPYCLYPQKAGYGDYVILNIDQFGFIENWYPKDIISVIREDE